MYVQNDLRGHEKLNFLTNLRNFIGFNLTNDETCVPRTPWKKEGIILDKISIDSEHFCS